MNSLFDDLLPCNRDEGERRKDAALALLECNREAVILEGRRALLHVLLIRGTATIDDVRGIVRTPPGVNPKAFGAVPSALAKAGIIVRDGYKTTSRAAAHARPVSRWKLIDEAAANAWLAAHPVPELEGGAK